jgi:hypothetical protein
MHVESWDIMDSMSEDVSICVCMYMYACMHVRMDNLKDLWDIMDSISEDVNMCMCVYMRVCMHPLACM